MSVPHVGVNFPLNFIKLQTRTLKTSDSGIRTSSSLGTALMKKMGEFMTSGVREYTKGSQARFCGFTNWNSSNLF